VSLRELLNNKVAEFFSDPDSFLSVSEEEILHNVSAGRATESDIVKAIIYFVATHGLNQVMRIPLDRIVELVYGGAEPESSTEVASVVSSAIRLDKFDYSTLGGGKVLDFWSKLLTEDKLCVIAGVPDIVFKSLSRHVGTIEAEAIILALISHFKSVLMVD